MSKSNFLIKARLFSWLLSHIGNVAIAAMMFLTTADVAGRYFFNAPVLGAYEITECLMLVLVFSFLGYAQSQKAHISVDIVFDRLPPTVRAFLARMNHVICLIMIIFVTVMGVYRTFDLKESHSESMLLRIPDHLFAKFMVVGCVVFCIEFLVDILKPAKTDKESEAK